MKEVKRFKCDHCSKVMKSAKFMAKHEPKCLKNPKTFNCFMCEFSFMGDYDFDTSYTITKDIPQCVYHGLPLPKDMMDGLGNYADTCGMYSRTAEIISLRDYDKAYANLVKSEVEDD